MTGQLKSGICSFDDGELFLCPLSVKASIIVCTNTSDYIMGKPEHVNEKEEKTDNGSDGIMSMVMAREDTDAHWVL